MGVFCAAPPPKKHPTPRIFEKIQLLYEITWSIITGMSEINDTQPSPVLPPAKKRSSFWITMIVFVAILLMGAIIGNQSGLLQRRTVAANALDQQLAEQFQLGVKAIDSGLYQVALQNFQFILQNDPNYPGAQDKLVEILLALSLTQTPMLEFTPMFTPTPDLRGAETIFNQARTSMAAKDWTGAIEALDSLRKVDTTYKTVEVDGMYYMALIQRGEGKIVNQDCTTINLEGGIYDLTLAERFGPLDNYGQSIRNWARLYITGASFWEIDWNQAIYYFDQLYRNMPYMMDSSCMTSLQRYRYAAIMYADSLVASGDVCGAKQYYDSALLISSEENSLVAPTATFVWEKCEENSAPPVVPTSNVGTATPTPTPGATETPTPDVSPTPSTPGP
jgi:tetratricopeptide (TPR) repeat protein